MRQASMTINTRRDSWIIPLVGVLLIFPHFLNIFLSYGSLSLGTMIISGFIVIFYIDKLNLKHMVIASTVLIFIVVHGVVAFGFVRIIPTMREILSYITLPGIVVSAMLISDEIRKCDEARLRAGISALMWVFIFIGVASFIVKPSFLGYNEYGKPVFPFGEPSHYIISATPFIIIYFTIFGNIKRLFVISFLSFFAFFKPSMTTLVVLSITIALTVFSPSRKYRWAMFIISLFVVVSAAALSPQGLGYFIDRIPIPASSDQFGTESGSNMEGAEEDEILPRIMSSSGNLTALVYLQGVEDMVRNLVQSDGWGIGFQNMGKNEPGEIGRRILSILGKYLNRPSGGFLAAKLVSEFGVFGIFAVIICIIIIFSSSLEIYKVCADQKKIFNIDELLVNSIIVSLFLYLFIRGYGYYSPNFVICLSAVYYLYENKVLNIQRNIGS